LNERSALADLAAWAEARLARLIDDACAAILDRISIYHDGQHVPADELHRSVEQNLRFIDTPLSPIRKPAG
jgi:hypothetical protein